MTSSNPKAFRWWEVLLMILGVGVIVWMERML
jgi:hypothetical protein